MSITRDRELLRFVESAIGHIKRACEAEGTNPTRSIEQAIARLEDLKSRLESDIGDNTADLNRRRAEGSK